jgi:hypothetical protein
MFDLEELGGGSGDWLERAEDRDRWWAIVSKLMNFGFHKCGEFID